MWSCACVTTHLPSGNEDGSGSETQLQKIQSAVSDVFGGTSLDTMTEPKRKRERCNEDFDFLTWSESSLHGDMAGLYTVLPRCYAPPFCDLLSGKRATCCFELSGMKNYQCFDVYSRGDLPAVTRLSVIVFWAHH